MARTVVITGCFSGFGDATALLFAARDRNIVTTMRRPEAGVALAQLGMANIDASVNTASGRLDAVINNAGYELFEIFEGTPRDKRVLVAAPSRYPDWRRQIQ